MFQSKCVSDGHLSGSEPSDTTNDGTESEWGSFTHRKKARKKNIIHTSSSEGCVREGLCALSDEEEKRTTIAGASEGGERRAEQNRVGTVSVYDSNYVAGGCLGLGTDPVRPAGVTGELDGDRKEITQLSPSELGATRTCASGATIKYSPTTVKSSLMAASLVPIHTIQDSDRDNYLCHRLDSNSTLTSRLESLAQTTGIGVAVETSTKETAVSIEQQQSVSSLETGARNQSSIDCYHSLTLTHSLTHSLLTHTHTHLHIHTLTH